MGVAGIMGGVLGRNSENRIYSDRFPEKSLGRESFSAVMQRCCEAGDDINNI